MDCHISDSKHLSDRFVARVSSHILPASLQPCAGEFMAKSRRRNTTLNATAESLGSALGLVAARLEKWKSERASIAADIQKLLSSASSMLGDLSDSASSGFSAARNKGGRPKGYKMSAATKAKLRAAWKRRKAAGAKKINEKGNG